MLQGAAQGVVVKILQSIKHSIGDASQQAGLVLLLAAQEKRAHHGRRRQRQNEGHGDRNRQDDGKFAEEPADDTAHEQNRNEHCNQRNAHRNDGEADLRGPLQSRLDMRHSALQMTRDILEHDDRIIDHEAGGDSQRHQREIVETVSAQLHDAERAENGNRHRHGRNERRAQAAQEKEDDKDDENDRDDQRKLGMSQRGADGAATITRQGHLDIARQGRLELRQLRPDAIDGGDDIATGLLEQNEEDGALPVDQTFIAQAFNRIVDFGDIAQEHGPVVAPGNDEVPVLRRLQNLVVGIELIASAVIVDRALGTVGVGG